MYENLVVSLSSIFMEKAICSESVLQELEELKKINDDYLSVSTKDICQFAVLNDQTNSQFWIQTTDISSFNSNKRLEQTFGYTRKLKELFESIYFEGYWTLSCKFKFFFVFSSKDFLLDWLEQNVEYKSSVIFGPNGEKLKVGLTLKIRILK